MAFNNNSIDYETDHRDDEPRRNDSTLSRISSADRIRSMLTLEEPDGEVVQIGMHPLFTQFDVLVHFADGTAGWKEISRWLKYEETVEVGGRWSKPYVPTQTMHGLQTLRQLIVDEECIVVLGVDTTQTIADMLAEMARDAYRLNDDVTEHIRNVVLEPHKHKHRKALKKHHRPVDDQLHVTVVDHVSLTQDPTESDGNSNEPTHHHSQLQHMFRRRSGDAKNIAAAFYHYPTGVSASNLAPYKPNKHLAKKLPKNCEAANILVGEVDFISNDVIIFCRLNEASVMRDLTEVELPSRFVFLVLGHNDDPLHDHLTIWQYSEIGRAMASLLTDKVFCEVAYKATTKQDLIDGIDEYIEDLTVLPRSLWDPNTRLEPPRHTLSTDELRHHLEDSNTRGTTIPVTQAQEEGAAEDDTLKRTGRVFGGLVKDIRTRYRHYLSDITDGLCLQSIATIIFLFFAVITPMITFGGLMGNNTDRYVGTMEMLMAGTICGLAYGIFSGQPLTIIGPTGPVTIFETIIYQLCKENDLHFLAFRFWIGIWIMIALLLIVAFDLSALVRYITRFTEESFAVLISLIFIYEAISKVIDIAFESYVHTGEAREDTSRPWLYECFCTPADDNITISDLATGLTTVFSTISSNLSKQVINHKKDWRSDYEEKCVTYRDRVLVRHDCMTEDKCLAESGNLTGDGCYVNRLTRSVPDVFFFSLILFIGTFIMAMALRIFRGTRFLPTILRSTIADFAVFLSIVTFTGIDYAIGIDTPKLDVPDEFKPTRNEDRGWIVNPLSVTYWWLILVAILPALLGTILIFLDQQITTVIVNRKEHKLRKGHGYHLDIFVLSFLIGICSLLGVGWFVASTVVTLTHVRSLARLSDVKVPGERPEIIGAREQRITPIAIYLLVAISTQITAVLRIIPMPVLYGVFLYMGVTALGGVQFVQRILVIVMPIKHQPDYIYLRHVKTLRVYLFTLVQIICMALMWVIKTIKIVSIAFPLMLIGLMAVRKLMDFVFTQSDLYWLDHLLPEEIRRKMDDERRKKAVVTEASSRPTFFMSGKPITMASLGADNLGAIIEEPEAEAEAETAMDSMENISEETDIKENGVDIGGVENSKC